MACPPVREILHSLRLVDYLLVRRANLGITWVPDKTGYLKVIPIRFISGEQILMANNIDTNN